MRTLRFTSLPAILVVLLLATRMPGQESSEAAAARRETETNLKALSARVEDLEASNHSLRVRLDDMRREVQQLREEMRKLADQSGTQEQLRKLAESVKEVDSKRRADNEKVLNELSKLARQIAETPVAPPPAPRVAPTPSGGESHAPRPPAGDKGSEKGIEYVIKSGDTLSGIVIACRGQNLRVTQKALMEANPEVNWNRLKVGQKIFIPLPNS